MPKAGLRPVRDQTANSFLSAILQPAPITRRGLFASDGMRILDTNDVCTHFRNLQELKMRKHSKKYLLHPAISLLYSASRFPSGNGESF